MWTYQAQLLRVLDADTIRQLIDTGFHKRTEQDVRLLDVSAPELSQPGGAESRQFVGDWMARLLPGVRWPLLVRTDLSSTGEERRSFTRYLGNVWDITDPARHLNADVAAFLAQHPDWPSGS